MCAQLRAPPVVGARTGQQQLRIELGADHEAGAERRAHAARCRVGAGEHHLGSHAVVVELLVALRRVPPAAQPAFVQTLLAFLVSEPLLLELVVTAHQQRATLFAHRREQRFAFYE